MITLTIPNMTCGGCAKSVTKALLNVDAQAQIETDPTTRKVQVKSNIEESTLRTALSAAGYPADPA
ncbi:heavy-metal-associated domain-containing protein [Providencia heimbachae]|uniref:Copper chaperone n=1 Tax=Providencia heimbachae ATCC 35613 TaxID=1354272 RepID=A0A1B7JVN2_9GAMM|nr:heavy-metal-associated domain-containing protein [Providencia heimbachae]OAT51960.1 copper chaperone [Providencia heimbachae ATCC 35613]SQH15213.1 putative mercuric reductase [Providencia heimbachae]